MTNRLVQIVQQSPRLGDLTKRRYARVADEFVAFAGEDPGRWTGEVAQAYYNMLLARMQPQSANAQLHALRYVSRRLAQLANNALLDFAQYVEAAAAGEAAPRRSLTREEIVRLLHTCGGHTPRDLRDYAIVTLGLKTGMRRSSMSGISFDDFGRDVANGFTYVEIALKGRRGYHHRVPLSETITSALAPWTRWLRTIGITSGAYFRGLAKPRIDGSVSVRGGLTHDGIYKAITGRAKEAGIEHVHPHLFRHTFITWAKLKGISNEEIAAITGHIVSSGTGASSVIDGTYTHREGFGPRASTAIDDDLWRGR